ncbi:MAG: HU family DNA-binding protein [Bdellovibrionales bacterium]|nr:HU family DNA-binding protein [Bdellovibrionales bacterium]
MAKAKKTTKKKTTKKKAAAKKGGAKTAKKTTKKKAASKKPAAKSAAKKAETVVSKTAKATTPKNKGSLAYTQSEFFDNVMGFCGLTKRSQAKEICEDIANFLKDALKRGYKVPLMGLGKMYVRKTKPRMGRNPATGEIIHIPAKKRVRFSVAKALKDAVL